MNTQISETLHKIEQSHGVTILYACETGSRAWGFPSPDSDYDVRMIYKHHTDWYLSLSEKTDTIEFMSEDHTLDITGWDIRKCLRLLWKSNGALLERIQSPIVYKEIHKISAVMRTCADSCFAPVAGIYHYLGMAKNSFAEIEGQSEIKLKKLFYALRAALACKWILTRKTIPPIVFMEMVDILEFDPKLKNRIQELINLKSGKNEDYMHPAEPDLTVFISQELSIAEQMAGSLPGRSHNAADLDTIFRQIIKTA